MIPGTQSKTSEETVASAASIVVKADLVRITGSTQIDTISSPLFLSGRGGVVVFLTPVDGAVTLGTAGNILVGQAMAQNRIYTLIYSAAAGKWYIHAVA